VTWFFRRLTKQDRVPPGNGVKRIAFADPIDFVGERGQVLSVYDMTPEARQALGAKILANGTVQLEFTTTNKLIALKILAQHLQLLQPEEAPPPPSGPHTVNYTEVYLDGLTDQELTVLEKVLERQAEVNKQYGLPSAPVPNLRRLAP
jgi:hypothetical protein